MDVVTATYCINFEDPIMRKICTYVVALLVSLFTITQGQAQDVTATIQGVVRDSAHLAVPGATVQVTNLGTLAIFKATSGPAGEYVIRSLPVGEYSIVAESSGFRRFQANGIRLEVNDVARFVISLEVGSSTEIVAVTSEALGVDTTSGTLKTVIDHERIEELPLNGRNPLQLAQLVVGVVASPNSNASSAATYPGVGSISINGGRANTANYILDGAQHNDHYTNAPNPLPDPDALQEFSVQTNNFSAEFGRQSGGVVNAVTRSGTNELHGSLCEFVRNKAFNAANYFAPILADGAKQDDGLKRNQFGGTVGGPIIFPHLYHGTSRTFFFFSVQQGTIRQAPSSGSIIVPTAAERAGDFSVLLPSKQLKNPLRGGIYAGNQIPASDIDKASLYLVTNFIPLPTSAGNTIFATVPNASDDRQYLGRIDHQISASNQVSGHYFDSREHTQAYLNPTDYFERAYGDAWLNQSVSCEDTHIFSEHLTNQVIVAFTRTDGSQTPINPAQSYADLGVNIYNVNPQYYITVSGYWGTVATGDTNSFTRHEMQYGDTIHWSRGRLSASFGGDFDNGAGDVVNNFRANGRYSYNGSGSPFTGDSFADYLIGKFNSFTQGVGEYRNSRFKLASLFAQTETKINHRLTVTAGIRWEPFFPYTDLHGKIAAWHPGQQSTRFVNAPPGVVFAGDAGVPAGGVNSIYTNFAPRIGFAWDVFGKGRTSIRGAYGVFFDHPDSLGLNSQTDQAPFGTVVTVNGNSTNSFKDPYAGTVNPFPISLTNVPSNASFAPYSSQFLYDSHFRNPYVQGWNLSVEQEVAGGFVLRASYAGSKATRLVDGNELNPAVYSPGVTTATTNQRRPLAPQLGSTALIQSIGNSTFNALQVTAERRLRKGFSVLANYQLSKSIDDSGANLGNAITLTDPFDRLFDKGPSEFDQRHVFNLSEIWEIPGRMSNRLTDSLVRGWALHGIVHLSSGLPFSIYSGVDNAGSGAANQRADLVGNPDDIANGGRAAKIVKYFNASAFAPNAVGTYGDTGRNAFRGWANYDVDSALVRNFPIHERLNFTFRFEVFNLLNHPNLQNPNGTLTSGANFLKTTAANDPRILQFGARLHF